MANWLDKAMGRRSETIVKPVPFMRTCPCGTQLSGVRQKRARRMICAACGEAHFILPANLYPESERLHFKSLELGEFEKSQEDIPQVELVSDPEIDIEDDTDDSELMPGRLALRNLERDEDSVDELEPKRRRAAPLSDEFDLPDEDEPADRIAVPTRQEERAGQRQKLLFVGVSFFVLVGAMAVWSLWERGQESAEVNLQTARDAGMIALEAGEFGEARRQFTIALEALDTLGVTGEQRDSMQRLWQECDTILGLSNNNDPFMVATAAHNTLNEGTEEDWALQFEVLFADSWILVHQAPLQIASGGPAGEHRLNLLFTIQEEDGGNVPIHLAGVDRLVSQSRTVEGSDGILFAGQLAGCRREADAWVIELNPDTAYLWRRFDSLRHLQMFSDEDQDILDLVERQAALNTPSQFAAAPREGRDET